MVRVCRGLSVEPRWENEDASFPFAVLLHAACYDERHQPMDGAGQNEVTVRAMTQQKGGSHFFRSLPARRGLDQPEQGSHVTEGV